MKRRLVIDEAQDMMKMSFPNTGLYRSNEDMPVIAV